MTPETIQLTKETLSWAAQQGYSNAEKAAQAFGKEIGEEMYCDQPYYNAWTWKKVVTEDPEETFNQSLDLANDNEEEPETQEDWLEHYGLREEDIMTDEKGRYIMVADDQDFNRVYLPEWLQ